MHSIDVIDECVAENEEYTVTLGVYEGNQPHFIVFGGGGAIIAPIEHEYELCSVSQVFTAALVQKLIACGELSLQSPLSAFLSEIESAKDFTVQDLLSHTTCIEMPLRLRARLYAAAFRPKNNPTKGISRAALLELLKACKISSTPQPCDINYALLGEIIASVGAASFERQIKSFICDDLKLTGFRVSNGTGTLPTPYWQRNENDSFLAANGVVANVTSCLRFLQSALHKNAFIAPCTEQYGNQKTHQGAFLGLGWLISPDGIVWQSGTNAGFNCFFGLDYKNERAVCVLSNTAAHARQSAAEAGLLYLREKQHGRELVFI